MQNLYEKRIIPANLLGEVVCYLYMMEESTHTVVDGNSRAMQGTYVFMITVKSSYRPH